MMYIEPWKTEKYEIYFVQFIKGKKNLKAMDVCTRSCWTRIEADQIVREFFKTHDRLKYAVEMYRLYNNGWDVRGSGARYTTVYIKSPVPPYATSMFENLEAPNRPTYTWD